MTSAIFSTFRPSRLSRFGFSSIAERTCGGNLFQVVEGQDRWHQADRLCTDNQQEVKWKIARCNEHVTTAIMVDPLGADEGKNYFLALSAILSRVGRREFSMEWELTTTKPSP
jgi:hypothetical protein